MQKIRRLMFIGLLAISLAPLAVAQEKANPEKAATTELKLTQCALKVSGMTCGGCAQMVEKGLLKVAGVKEAKVDWKTGDVKVQYDQNKITPEKTVAAFNEVNKGFRAELPKTGSK